MAGGSDKIGTAQAVTVGVTGHRTNRLPEMQWPRLRSELATVMAQIEAEHPRQRCTLISGLAEGADQLAAFAALGRGWRLHAILAFHRSRFEKDFSGPSSVGEFRALLSAAHRITEPGPRWHIGRSANEGYHTMGTAMLALSQRLIAIWDGEPSRGRGGTIEVIEQALRLGLPVVWVHAAKCVHPQVLLPSTEARGVTKVDQPKLRSRPSHSRTR
ncbi:MAG TPA: hypothetical protein VNK52_15935 [Hyphomicrobiaceae bacterium]|nr:hypothetical protein [Hyphomicrobiaceae bacterium]